MQLCVVPTVMEARAEELIGKTVLVIDVLRATSTIAAALAAGSSGVVPAETVSEAQLLRRDGYLLGGERQCRPIEGFDLGNSPFEYTPGAVAGRTIILTTTNGTRGIRKAEQASSVFAASVLNAGVCAQAALQLGQDVILLCAGTHDCFSLEDGLCAGLLIEEMQQRAGCVLAINDLGVAMHAAYLQAAATLQTTLLSCTNGKRLTALGLTDDVLACSAVNALDVVPYVGPDRTIVPYKF